MDKLVQITNFRKENAIVLRAQVGEAGVRGAEYGAAETQRLEEYLAETFGERGHHEKRMFSIERN